MPGQGNPHVGAVFSSAPATSTRPHSEEQEFRDTPRCRSNLTSVLASHHGWTKQTALRFICQTYSLPERRVNVKFVKCIYCKFPVQLPRTTYSVSTEKNK